MGGGATGKHIGVLERGEGANHPGRPLDAPQKKPKNRLAFTKNCGKMGTMKNLKPTLGELEACGLVLLLLICFGVMG